MKSFEKIVRKRVLLVTLYAVLGGLVVITALIIKLVGNIETDTGLTVEMLIGLFVGMEITAIFRILQYRKALGDQESLEELHIKESDERNRIITLKTCRSSIYLALTLLGVAGLIASFFSRTVTLTIGIVLIALVVLYFLLFLYYSRKH